MNNLKTRIENFKGELSATPQTLELYSHDASLFEIKPQLVAFPKDSADVCALVEYVKQNKSKTPQLSITPRSAGTDMSGGAINDSIIVAFEKHFTKLGEVINGSITTQPGVFYRDFEAKTLLKNLLLPSFPASREICMVGGMVANNSGGEKSLIYHKTDHYVQELKVIFSDGMEHTVKPLSGQALQDKLQEKGFEGDLYRSVHQILIANREIISASQPQVSKNSTGYNIWDAWDGKTLDLTKLLTGSQGTLGLITEIKFKLVPAKPLSGMMVVLMPSLKNLGDIINAILPLRPSSLESFDDHTLKFAFQFFYSFHKTLGWKRFLLLGLSFIPVLNKLFRFLPHFPKLVLLVEFEGDQQSTIDEKLTAVAEKLAPFNLTIQRVDDKRHETKFWIIRRESFNLLRHNVKRKHTAPFIDDLVVPPKYLPEFLPQLIAILEKHQLLYTIAGHLGDGNFHIIPLMDLTKLNEREKIPIVLKEVIDLVLKYKGSLSGEHNDGLIRGPFLKQMYSPKIVSVFEQIKQAFDETNIFNPHKKITADWDYSQRHIRKRF